MKVISKNISCFNENGFWVAHVMVGSVELRYEPTIRANHDDDSSQRARDAFRSVLRNTEGIELVEGE